MKKLVLFVAVICFSSVTLAQSDKYVSAMKTNIALMDSMMVKANGAELANNFERIADAEKTQWLPYYYAALATVSGAYTEKDNSKKDALADKAQQLIDKAEAILGKDNSETNVIKSMIATAHMMVDPQNRWQQYGQTSAENIAKAKKFDATNPRPVYLEAQGKFYTPEEFGGGKSVAKPIFEKALAMFDGFKPASNIAPSWGKSATEYFISQCN